MMLAGSSVASAAATYVLSDRDAWMGAEGTALGGALVAGSSGRSDFVYANPASPAFAEKYTIGISYGTVGDQLRAQIIDTKSSKIGGGVSFSQRNIDNLGSYEDPSIGNFGRLEHSAVVSLMTRISDTVAVGVSGHHRYIRPQGGLVPNTFWSGDVGLMVQLNPEWTLGLAGLDMIADTKGYTYRTLSLGLSGKVGSGLTVSGQIDFLRTPEGSLDTGFVRDEATPSAAIAADFAVNPELRLRGSYRTLPSWEQKFVGLGLGYVKDTLSLDYGMRFSTENSKTQYHTVSLSVDM
ncbi:MAG: hypothetical protein ABIO95_00280 [Bdellovibrionota bacterium]